jgi:hypothetical protein
VRPCSSPSGLIAKKRRKSKKKNESGRRVHPELAAPSNLAKFNNTLKLRHAQGKAAQADEVTGGRAAGMLPPPVHAGARETPRENTKRAKVGSCGSTPARARTDFMSRSRSNESPRGWRSALSLRRDRVSRSGWPLQPGRAVAPAPPCAGRVRSDAVDSVPSGLLPAVLRARSA